MIVTSRCHNLLVVLSQPTGPTVTTYWSSYCHNLLVLLSQPTGRPTVTTYWSYCHNLLVVLLSQPTGPTVTAYWFYSHTLLVLISHPTGPTFTTFGPDQTSVGESNYLMYYPSYTPDGSTSITNVLVGSGDTRGHHQPISCQFLILS